MSLSFGIVIVRQSIGFILSHSMIISPKKYPQVSLTLKHQIYYKFQTVIDRSTDSDRMHSYQDRLRYLKTIIVVTETVIFLIRFTVQRGFTMATSLLILQILMSSIICCRHSCAGEAKIYLVISMIMLYLIFFNLMEYAGNGKSNSEMLSETFYFRYEVWGYSAEVPIRLFFMIVVWRVYQYAKCSFAVISQIWKIGIFKPRKKLLKTIGDREMLTMEEF